MKRPIILFDGVCNLCKHSIQFIIKHDRSEHFTYETLQSETGTELAKKYGIDSIPLNSVVLIQDGKAYQRSTAMLKILRQLKAPWPLFYGFIIFPPFIRDAIYNFIGKRRYKWFGKMDQCWRPTKKK